MIIECWRKRRMRCVVLVTACSDSQIDWNKEARVGRGVTACSWLRGLIRRARGVCADLEDGRDVVISHELCGIDPVEKE